MRTCPRRTERVALQRLTVVAVLLLCAGPSTSVMVVAEDANVTADTADMPTRCRQEILELHRFFDDWFNARIDNTDSAFARVARTLAPSFEIVAPNGRLIGRDALLEDLRAAHGGRAGTGFRIWVKEIRPRQVSDGFWVVTYEEWQQSGDATRGRLSSALMAPDDDAPAGVIWLHLHETWIEGRE